MKNINNISNTVAHHTRTHSAKKNQMTSVPDHLAKAPKTKQMTDTNRSVQTIQRFNQKILQANIDISISRGNDSMALLYKTAIEGINDILKDQFGDQAIQNAYESGLDTSYEATADRIVSMSTAFFDQYQKQNPDMGIEKAAKSFVQIIGSGIDKGFADARKILDGLQLLQGDIAKNIDTTYDLVQEGLSQFIDRYTPTDDQKTQNNL